MEQYYLQMNGHTFILEWGFDPSLTKYDTISEFVGFYHRYKFCSTPNESTVNTIVYEFYSFLKDREIRKLSSDNLNYVTVWGKQVLVTPWEISLYYDASYYVFNFLESFDLNVYRGVDMDTILRYLT